MLNNLCSKDTSQKQKAEIATILKDSVEELITENTELKQRLDRRSYISAIGNKGN
jgi:hypothetical protein